jgi:hypothetical protein
MTPWPRLSETLPHPRDLKYCQGCGAAGSDLRIWQEHDEADHPEPIHVVLCEVCAENLIEPHPRLYRCLDRYRWEPAPGLMPTCLDCVHHKGLVCGSPLLRANGGPGLPINAPIEVEGFACTRGKGCRRFVQYAHPPECKGREPQEAAR